MATSPQEEQLIERYLNAAGSQDGEHYLLAVQEVAWLLRHTDGWDSLRLRVLTALQRGLLSPKEGGQAAAREQRMSVQELKEALTNVIIMQTRLKEREGALINQLEGAAAKGLVQGVTVDATDLREGARSLLQGYRHLQERASQPRRG